jgi:beta-phosphoglucomutase
MGHHNRAWQQFFAKYKMLLGLAEIKERTYGKNNREILGDLFSHLSDDDLVTLGEEKEDLYRQIYQPEMKLVEGLGEFLVESERLQIPLAIASAAGKRNIDFVMAHLNLHAHFPVVVGAHDVQRGKPHPDLFLAAAQKLNVSPEACVVFEDALPGVEAAHLANMPAIAITTTYEAAAFANAPAVKRVIDDFVGLTPMNLFN